MAPSQPAGIDSASFLQRVITGALFSGLFLAALIAGNAYFILPLLCALCAGIGTLEFYNLTAPTMNRFIRFAGVCLAVALPLCTVVARLFIPENPVIGTGGLAGLSSLFYVIAIALTIYIGWVAFTPTSRARDAALSFFGALYLGLPLSCLVLIRSMEQGVYLASLMIVSVWVTDAFAYVGGSLFGRHKLAPVISPKKSWEGFIVGTFGAIIAWSVLPLITHDYYPFWVAVLMGTLISVTSLAGDLFESRIKREAQKKDSGTLLPGHGGLLDRLDSTLSVSLIMFVLLSTIGVLLNVVNI